MLKGERAILSRTHAHVCVVPHQVESCKSCSGPVSVCACGFVRVFVALFVCVCVCVLCAVCVCSCVCLRECVCVVLIERNVLRNVTVYFVTTLVYITTQFSVGSFFSLSQLAVPLLGVLLPPPAIWNPRSTRRYILMMMKENVAKFGFQYRVARNHRLMQRSIALGCCVRPFHLNRKFL